MAPMMSYERFNRFCAALPATTHVVQWRGSDVWKVGGKVFAIGGWADEVPAFTFKTDPITFDTMRDMPGVRPAPYLASRGFSWLQHYAAPGLPEDLLEQCLRESHRIVCRGLTKKLKRELGLDQG